MLIKITCTIAKYVISVKAHLLWVFKCFSQFSLVYYRNISQFFFSIYTQHLFALTHVIQNLYLHNLIIFSHAIHQQFSYGSSETQRLVTFKCRGRSTWQQTPNFHVCPGGGITAYDKLPFLCTWLLNHLNRTDGEYGGSSLENVSETTTDN